MSRRNRAPNRTYIRLRLSPMGKLYAFLVHGGGSFYFLALVLAMGPGEGSSQTGTPEDSVALGTLAGCLVAAFAAVWAAGRCNRAHQRDVQRAVLELIRHGGPMRRAQLLKAARPEYLRPAIRLATYALLATGQLTHSAQGYSVPSGTRATEQPEKALESIRGR